MPNADVTISRALAKLPVVQLWEPLRHARFRRLWVANLIANLGNGIHAFAVAWLIATISHAPSTAAMVQTLAYPPLLLFALPAGVIADVVCRPKVLFLANLLMAICSGGCFILATTLDLDVTLVPVLFTLGSMFWGALADREGAASSVIAAGCASLVNAIFILCSKNSTVRK